MTTSATVPSRDHATVSATLSYRSSNVQVIGTRSMSGDGRAPRIKNRAPAPIQITAEQLLREAQERQIAPKRKTPRVRIESYEELEDYRARKRTEYEDAIRRLRGNVRNLTYLHVDGCLDKVRNVGSYARSNGPVTLGV